ncbi:hypothetical protein HN681_01635 [archaeon]|jgi:hypothetical protein|nr:hypothetical protein [archaeon]MBT3731248.1 hypothetical protein [archaeon]MBT4669998.1 hypothetical protein [archaeon]MBT5287800.1 hypothetical protein [archaeon]MBT7052366.1 hypothetical protein [archaeon]
MDEISTVRIIKTSIVTAFTLVAAFIWRDVIIDAIDLFFPTSAIYYEFLAAIIVTIFVIIAIYITLKTESEAEYLLKKYKHFYKLEKIQKKKKS